MRARVLFIFIAIACAALAAVSSRADDKAIVPPPDQSSQHPPPPQATAPPAAAKEPSPPPSVTIISAREAHGVLGRDVRSAANEDMGRIVDVIVDRTGLVRAAVIDFGGFLGVGSRKIVVDWNALHFGPVANKSDSITLELPNDQAMGAPDYHQRPPLLLLSPARI